MISRFAFILGIIGGIGSLIFAIITRNAFAALWAGLATFWATYALVLQRDLERIKNRRQ